MFARVPATLLGTLLAAALSLPTIAVAADPPVPITAGDVKVSTDNLELLLKPLTKGELVIEADAWQKILQEKVREISNCEIAAAAAEGDARTKLLEQAAAGREARTAIIDRLNVVLSALRAKGGKSDDYDTYRDAVSGMTVKLTDAGAAWTGVSHWLQSPEGGIRYGRNILMFLATLVVFRVISGVARGVARRALGAMKQMSNLLRDFMVNALHKIIMFVGFVVALSMLEVNIGPFLAAMGAAGFVIGFALQGTLSNFASGIMILLYRPYDLNNTVTIAGQKGNVQAMSLVSTVLKNADGHTVTIPNSAIWGGTITVHANAA
ncbi:MAG: mechanosensitive ion channel [Phycisphaerales bacterium]|nr:mechanosensitive ion channel [Phycisphaerales bacterium]